MVIFSASLVSRSQTVIGDVDFSEVWLYASLRWRRNHQMLPVTDLKWWSVTNSSEITSPAVFVLLVGYFPVHHTRLYTLRNKSWLMTQRPSLENLEINYPCTKKCCNDHVIADMLFQCWKLICCQVCCNWHVLLGVYTPSSTKICTLFQISNVSLLGSCIHRQ